MKKKINSLHAYTCRIKAISIPVTMSENSQYSIAITAYSYMLYTIELPTLLCIINLIFLNCQYLYTIMGHHENRVLCYLIW